VRSYKNSSVRYDVHSANDMTAFSHQPRFRFRAFSSDGRELVTANPTHDSLRGQEHLVPVLGTIGNALAGRPATCKLVLDIESTELFHVEWTAIGKTIGVARLVRGETDAILVAVLDANDSVMPK